MNWKVTLPCSRAEAEAMHEDDEWLELFDNLLIPYLSYQDLRSEVTAGFFPGTPIDTETTTAGLRVMNSTSSPKNGRWRCTW